eukprot:TRINITY_DN1919_c0_g5_i1.p1 TRINITY_DN1919_c0_g5~~TRINITY_DN1919_c0_g5_i1.p1  ORF type:complete len:130 (+),score=12.19 TRINITY_DN1919_c0_g5_i1:202-591(+)
MRGLKQDFLRPLTRVKDPAEFQKGFTKKMAINYIDTVDFHRRVIPEDSEQDLCKKVAEAGPQGQIDFNPAQRDIIYNVKNRSLDIFREHAGTYRLHHMAYVRHLLQGETEEETMAALVAHGWLPKAADA